MKHLISIISVFIVFFGLKKTVKPEAKIIEFDETENFY